MTRCDNCDYEDSAVTLGDSCPECGKLVGIRVPSRTSSAVALADYDVEGSDADLREAVGEVAQRNFNTLLLRKRKLEKQRGFAAPVDAEEKEVESGSPPNADPAKATTPEVTPQPDGADSTPDPAEDETPAAE